MGLVDLPAELPAWWQSTSALLGRKSKVSRLPFAIVAVFILLIFWYTSSGTGYPEYASSTYAVTPFQPEQNKPSFLPFPEAERLCNSSGSAPVPVYPDRSQHRKVYDAFLFGSELDWLEIRLHELAPWVDYFVIVESVHTFTNHKKPLYFRDNWARFAPYAHQIIHRVIETQPNHNGSTWDRERYQRDALFEAVFPSLVGHQAPHMGDVLMVSDVDEIPKPETLVFLRNCDFPEHTTLRSNFFYYSFQWEHDGDWPHPQATFYQGYEKTVRPDNLRGHSSELDISNSSWHCSYCFANVADFQSKLTSFSHTEYDKPEFKDPSEIVRRVRNGLDLFDRDWEHFVRTDMGNDLPKFLLSNPQRFPHMLDRDPENANFKDYPQKD